ncbi:MAG TPA: inner membrane CreD family protein [Thermoanaerobaculia bacterium]
MRFRNLAAIFFIFVCTSAAWMILGGTIFVRTQTADGDLRGKVASTWGEPQVQVTPGATYTIREMVPTTTVENGREIVRYHQQRTNHPLDLEQSRVIANLALDHRRKGLLWYATYKVGFWGAYRFRNPGPESEITFRLPFPAAKAVYDGLVFRVDGRDLPVSTAGGAATAKASVAPGESALLEVAYSSQGLDTWSYDLGGEVASVRDFHLKMTTDFGAIDFPDATLSPTWKQKTAKGWDLVWSYQSLVSGVRISMRMPERLQPGPLAGRISYFAPVSLFFFFFVMLLITTLRGIELHPMNYFFLAAAFFAFHLLLAYLVDHIDIHAAFATAAAVSVFLVVSYLRLVVGLRFAAVEAAGAQMLYLVLLSYAFFFKGFTGLAVTIGAILTLFVAMQLTGRIRWGGGLPRPAQFAGGVGC